MFTVTRFVYVEDCGASLKAEVVFCSNTKDLKKYIDATFNELTSYFVEWNGD